VGHRAGLDAVAKRKIPCPCRESNFGRPTRSLKLECYLEIIHGRFLPDPFSFTKLSALSYHVALNNVVDTSSLNEQPSIRAHPSRIMEEHLHIGTTFVYTSESWFSLCLLHGPHIMERKDLFTCSDWPIYA